MDPTQDQTDLFSELDKQLLARVKSGAATAAELNVARQRLRDLGLTQTIKSGDDIDELGKLLGHTKDYLPTMSEEKDEATL